jgi:hypothetical protein
MKAGTPENGINGTISIYGNLVIGGETGIYSGGKWNTSSVNVYNNTFYPSVYYALYFYGMSGSGTPFHVKNNIFITDNFSVMKFNTETDETLTDHSYNLLYRYTGTTYVISPDPTTRNAAWVTGTWDTTSLVSDPLFISAGYYAIQQESPANLGNGQYIGAYPPFGYARTVR